LGNIYKCSVATAQLLGAENKLKVACPESESCVVVASHVAAQPLNNIEVGDDGFTFVAKRVASFRVIVAQLRCMVSQLRNCVKLNEFNSPVGCILLC
jgi:hypothetical protein